MNYLLDEELDSTPNNQLPRQGIRGTGLRQSLCQKKLVNLGREGFVLNQSMKTTRVPRFPLAPRWNLYPLAKAQLLPAQPDSYI